MLGGTRSQTPKPCLAALNDSEVYLELLGPFSYANLSPRPYTNSKRALTWVEPPPPTPRELTSAFLQQRLGTTPKAQLGPASQMCGPRTLLIGFRVQGV